MISANQTHLTSWISVPENSDFPIQNIPFGIFKTANKSPRVATRIGDTVIDLFELFQLNCFSKLPFEATDFDSSTLNSMMKKGKGAISELRNELSILLQSDHSFLRDNVALHSSFLHDESLVEMLLPVAIGDYTDFYSLKLLNIGKLGAFL